MATQSNIQKMHSATRRIKVNIDNAVRIHRMSSAGIDRFLVVAVPLVFCWTMPIDERVEVAQSNVLLIMCDDL